MRNFTIIFLLVFINLSCSADNNGKSMNTQNGLITVSKTLGVGWLEITGDYPIPVYRNPTDSLPYDILKLKVKKSFLRPNDTGQWKITWKTKIDLNPYCQGWNNGRTLIFRVVNSADSTYRIVTNEETFETCCVNIKEYLAYNDARLAKANPYKFKYNYETWLDYLKRSEIYIEKKNITIYDKPNGQIIFENKEDNFLPFGVVDMEGDWIKLEKLNIYRSRYRDSINYEGWTRWKENEKLVIIMIENIGIE